MKNSLEKSETNTSPATTSFKDFKNFEEMIAFGDKICKSNFSPLKKGEDVVAALLLGKELGFDVMTSIQNIYPINGRGSLGIHLISSLCMKAGITYKILKDYQPLYQIALVKDKVIVGTREGFINEPLFEGEKRNPSPIDYVTIIEFSRKVKQPDGTWEKMTVESSYSIREATQAELTVKDNWIKNPKTMVRTRALSLGYRLIGDDVINGMYEHSELADVYNMKYNVTEDGAVTIIENKPLDTLSKKDTTSNTVIEEVEPIN